MLFTVYILFFSVVNTFFKIKNRERFYFITVIGLSLLSFTINPTREMDLYTHYKTLDFMRTSSLESVLAMKYVQYDGLPVYAIFFYFISKLGNNKLLLAITYIVDYGCQFKILSMAREDFNLSKDGERWAYNMILLLTNVLALTGVRNMLAFSLCALMIYYDLVRRKYRLLSITIYILMCLFHESVVTIVGFRIFVELINLKIFNSIKVFIIFWPCLLNFVLKFLNLIEDNTFFNKLSQKVMIYTSVGNDYRALGGDLGLLQIYLELGIVIFILIISFFQRKSVIKKSKYYQFFLVVSFFCLGCSVLPQILVRYISFCIFLVTPLYAESFKIRLFNRNFYLVSFCHVAIVSAIIIGFINLVYSQYSILP